MDNNNQPLSPRALREAAHRRLRQGLTDVSSSTVTCIQSLVSELELHQEELRIQNEELQQARDRLEIAREIAQTRYRDLFERAPMGYLLLDAKGCIQEANRAANALFAPGTDLVGHDLFAFVAADSQDALHLHRRALATKETSQAVDLTLAGDENAPRMVRMESVVEPAAESGTARFRCAVMDITERRQTEDQLRIAVRVSEDTGDAIVVMDSAGRIQSVNKAYIRITGCVEKDVLGTSLNSLIKTDRHGQASYKDIWEHLNQRGFWQGEIWGRRKSGEVFPGWMILNRLDDDQGQPRNLVGVFSDISQIKDSQRKIEYLASHDTLTGLPNRSLFQDRAHQAFSQARSSKRKMALMILDLDHFKDINDTLGHEVGDALLRQVAAQLRKRVRDVDTVARIGGDEFAVVFADCDVRKTALFAQHLMERLAGTFEVRGSHLRITASAGLALYPEDGDDVDTLCQAAEIAMYRAKESGRNRLRLYELGLYERLREDRALEEALRRALTHQELRLMYQPQFDARDPDRLVGAEALLRWENPEKGTISPARFIPIAEKSDLITELSQRVVALLCEQLGAWRAVGLFSPPISFNVSPKDFRGEGVASGLFRSMARHDVTADQLQIEFTESALIEHSDIVNQEIHRLNAEGIELAIDDFGTGHSSLVNLKRFPLAELKIDKSFVDGLCDNERDEAIVRASLAMAQAFGLRTVAEGVESQQQLAWLQEHGCDRIQGFLLARPLEASSFQAMLRDIQNAT
ncbi:putative bifunctional diguanylate cyclase/phosphodiesterase [Halomonas lysinitropha]|uniref:Cyclic di-GMP phosphodiesterase Gmr n=1 Tax=Halomonas lysinitropha TaxID=2607506 RepID=A0A5K1I603_9GAMM|nr:EAL domain-containing protein [Halomonas lysinitropha]VVZ95811.1 Cyclic di-GMP phosphodiesterase Gmr [Halomonas lysinitropha]